MCPGDGNPPGGGDKPPGVFKVRSYEDPTQAKEKIDNLVAKKKEFVVTVTTYKETE